MMPRSATIRGKLTVNPPPPPQITSVTANKGSPQSVGAAITWTCEATGSGTLRYAWYLYRDGERVHVQVVSFGEHF